MTANSLLDLENEQIELLIEELKSLEPTLDKQLKDLLSKIDITPQEAMEYLVTNDPKLWAKVYLNWEARDYQIEMLNQGKKAKKLVLRLGRRLGKTECMCILILWYAYTQMNACDENKYDIIIITPYEAQVDLIFDRLKQLIDLSPVFKGMIKRDVYHRIELVNGTKIKGFTAGSKSGSGAASTRGQRADLLVMDEIDYMGSSEITNIMNIRNENPGRIKILAASTPSGKHEEYWKWCTGASKKFYPKQEDIDNFTFTSYLSSEQKGNGWIEIYSPSTVNKELVKINEDTGQTFLEDLKDELSEMRFLQEVMAEFGEEAAGVYRKEFIDKAMLEGERIGHRYILDKGDDYVREYVERKRVHSKFLLGVDWDKFQAGTNIVCIEYDPFFINKFGMREPKFIVLFRIEIPKSRFTYTEAVNKIIELNDLVNFDHIAVDRGYGESQIEMLVKYGMNNPSTGLEEKVIGYQFGQKITVRDPHTGKKDEKPLKPFMVNNSVITFEKEKIVFDPTDKIIAEQFGGYIVKSVSSTGMPIFSDENEHIIDAVNLCLLVFEQNYSDLMRRIITTKVSVLGPILGKEEHEIQTRDFANYDNDMDYYDPSKPLTAVVKNKNPYGTRVSKFNFSRGSF